MNSHIPIKNLYYLLAYAFSALKDHNYSNLEKEDFDSAEDLFAEILILAVSKQLKQGLKRGYLLVDEEISSVRGKILLAESFKEGSLQKKKLVCSHDEYNEDCYFNRIIKTTLILLLKSRIVKDRKSKIRHLLKFFENVSELNPHRINWKQQYDRNSATYRLIIYICNLLVNSKIQSNSKDGKSLEDYIDERELSHLYEKFILGFYRRHYSDQLSSDASQIEWAKVESDDLSLLPSMKSDITLTSKTSRKVLIIDAKFYSQSLQKRFDKFSIHSENLYQIFTYVKNKTYASSDREVSGLLLYAKTDHELQPKAKFKMSGNDISVDNLDLSTEFSFIKAKLDEIIRIWNSKNI